MLRRTPLSLPHPRQTADLARAVLGEASIAPRDPTEFTEAAIEHRLVGAVNKAVEDGRLQLPAQERSILRDAHAVTVLKAGLLRHGIGPAAQALRSALGVPPVVLKGPAIADRFYPDPALRTFSDLDLLVARAQLQGGATALEALGYQERVELQPGFGATHGHDIHLVKRVGRHDVDIELHWRIGDDVIGEALSHAALRQDGELAPDDSNVVYPAPPDQLLVCSVHLLSDRLKRLSWIEDVRRISAALDDRGWRGAFDRADELGLLWVLHRALDYAERHLRLTRDRPLPAGEPPPFGPLRAVEEIDMRFSLHLGRLATLPWSARGRYLRDIALPSRAGLEGTVGGDGAPAWRLAIRHLGRARRGLGS
jgi:hypothetical protein